MEEQFFWVEKPGRMVNKENSSRRHSNEVKEFCHY
jgi:hypothetical protein